MTQDRGRREMVRRGDVRKATMVRLPNGTIGNEGRCNRCGAEVVWAQGRWGRAQPFDRDGELHSTSCPDRDE